MSSSFTTPAISSAGLSIAGLRDLIKRDAEASANLQRRIDQLRQDILDGKEPPTTKIAIMESSNKDMTKDLVRRIEAIEDQGSLEATDREMLQALNARLAVCDTQAMRLAELRNLEMEFYGKRQRTFLENEDEHQAAPEAEEVLPASKPKTSKAAASTEEAHPASEPKDSKPMEDHDAPKPIALQRTKTFSFGTPERTESFQVVGEGRTVPSGPNSLDDDDEQDSDDGDRFKAQWMEPDEPDKTKWPLLYRILDVDPKTKANAVEKATKQARLRLGAFHDPARRPNDKDAVERWKPIMKASTILADPERKMFYDMHHRNPPELEDFDLSRLSLDRA